jgi:hypothetical protein
MKNIRKTIASALLIIISLLELPGAVAGCGGGESTATTVKTKAFIWQVTSNTTSVYLMGSVHIARPDIYPLDDTIENAFDDADYLAVELNPKEANLLYASLLVARYGSYPEGESLKDSIGEELYYELKRNLTAPDINIDYYLEQYRPWVLFMAVSQSIYESLDYEAESGIDMHFIEKAMKKGKEITELETVEYQVTQLSSIPDEVIVEAMLADVGKDPEEEIDAMFEAWLSGDSTELSRMIFEGLEQYPGMAPMYEKLFFERNIKMAEKIEEFLSGSDVYFIVVGAGHLVGEKGLVNLVAESGYTVEQLYNRD